MGAGTSRGGVSMSNLMKGWGTEYLTGEALICPLPFPKQVCAATRNSLLTPQRSCLSGRANKCSEFQPFSFGTINGTHSFLV